MLHTHEIHMKWSLLRADGTWSAPRTDRLDAFGTHADAASRLQGLAAENGHQIAPDATAFDCAGETWRATYSIA